jgi:hypothetical protein
MAAGTVISGGFPGRVAQEVTPNPKCHGCLHYDGQAGRTGACTIGLRPWLCGDGGAAEIGYAPITHGAGTYLPDMSTHGAHAREVETQFVSDLYGSGSTKPVTVQTVSLGDEAVGFIKSMVDQHMEMERSVCRLCKSIGTTIGATPYTNGPQVCTCEPIKATEVAKALVGRMSNRQRASMTLDDVTEFVYDVAKAGYKLPPLKKACEVEAIDKSYNDDWLCQFKGTPLFKLAHQLCEQELAQQEAALKRREDSRKHDKERSAALAKLERPSNYDWQEQDALRERLQIAKQRLTLKLAEHQQKKMG